jgi:DNA (cytosine-5)-methyltransferase 1
MTVGKMKPVFETILSELGACGYQVTWNILNAQYYNVPQQRHRVIIIGVRNDLGILPHYPLPNAYVITLREALAGLEHTDQLPRPLTESALQCWYETAPGSSHTKRFNLYRCSWDKPTTAVCKTIGGGGHTHPDIPRFLNIAELKRITSFPDDFEFVGSWNAAWARIGNSVPPKFMQAIAEHVRDTVLVVNHDN